MRKCVIVVQARVSSSRLPGKVLLPILGKSLLYRMVERLRMIRHEATLVIATSTEPEDDAVEAEAEAMNVPCYEGSLTNLLDRHYQVGKRMEADVVVKSRPIALIDPRAVDEVFDYFVAHEGEFDFVSNLHPATWPDGNDVELMTMPSLERAWREAKRSLEWEHTTPYFWENPHLFRLGNVRWPTGLDYSLSHRFTIDYQEDYEFIKAVFEVLYPINKLFSCDDILDLLQRRPELFEINNRYAGVNWYRHHLHELKTVG